MFRIIRRSYALIFIAVLALCVLLGSALAEDARWEYRLDEDGCAHITAFADASADWVQVPARLDGHDVIGIDAEAFSACSGLKEIRLLGSVSALAEGAFDGPESLCLAGYNGSAALNYAGQHGLDSRNLSLLDFLPGVIDLSDVDEGDYKLNGSTVYLRNPQARRIAKEDIFYLPVNNGTAYKAVSFTQENGWVAIQTATPTFDLVVEKLSLRETEFYPDYNGITMLSRDVTFEPESRSGNALSGTFKYQFNPAVSVSIKVKTSLDQFVCDVTSMPFRVNEFTYQLNTSCSVKIIAKGNAQLLSDINSNQYREWIDLVRVPFASASGLVTANLVFRIRLTLDAGFVLDCSVENFKDGLSYTPQNGWSRLNEAGTRSVQIEGSAKVEYTTGLAATVSVPLLGDFMTIQGNTPLSAEAKYAYQSDNPETISCLDVDAKWEAYISAGVGLNSKYFDKKLGINLTLEYESPRLSLWDKNFHFEAGKLVEKCTKKVYWVKLVPGNGEILPDIRVCGSDIPLLPSLSREGYTFTDWYTSPACTADSRVTNDMFSNRDKDLTLYGGWRPVELPEEEEIEFPENIKETDARYGYANCPSTIVINEKTYKIRPVSAATGEPHNTPLRKIINRIVEDGYMSWEQVWGKKEMPADTLFWAYNLHSSERITHMSYESNFVGTEGNSRCINLASVSFPNGMIDIGTYFYCTKLTYISLPQALESIRKQAFYGCTGLTQISVPASCKTIGAEAFAHSGLTGISLPNGVETISGAFQNAYKLTHASVPSSVTANAYAFKNCFALSSVSIDEGVEKIGKGMFQDCRKLSSVGIPASVKTIDEAAFLRTGVTGISVMGDGVFIGASAFADTPLRSFSGNVSEIESGAFGDTPNLETVVLSGKDLEVYSSAFGGSGLKNLQIGVSGKLRVSLDNLPHLERLSISADEIVIDCTNLYSLKDVSISANVVQLGSFSGCQNLQKVDVNAMKIYGYADFSSCTSLTVLNLSGVLYGIPNLFATKIRSFSAAVECNSDDDNMSMYGVTNLNMLNGAINMDSITLSGSLGKVMGNIKDCHELERVDLRSAEITSIDMSGFGGVEIYLPDNVPEVISGGTAMIYCKNGSVTAAACDAKGIPHAEPGQEWRMLTIVYNNGQPDGSMLFSAGNAPIALDEPEDINCNFLGWYTDEELKQPYSNLTAMPNHDLTLYAGWELVFFKPRYSGEYDMSMNNTMNGEYGYGSYLTNYTRERTILPIHQVYVLDNCFQTKMLREIIIKDTVKSIGKNVFSAEPYLEKITVDSGNKYYYDVDGVLYSKAGALIACPPQCSSTVLNVPKGIKTIASGAFGSESTVSTLEEIHLPDSIRTIEEGALAGLNQYTLIYGPNRTDIASAVEVAGLMYNCYPIGFVLDDEIISILYGKQGELLPAVGNPHLPGRIFQGWSLTEGGRAINLNTYKMPANKLMLYAVHSGSGAVSILPDMLKAIEAEAFEGSALENVCCQPGLLRIEARAFAGCAQLKVVDLPDTVTFIAEDAFDGSAQVTILAPAGSYAEEFAKAHGIPCKNP